MLNLTGDDIITMLLKNTLITDTADYLIVETDFPKYVKTYKETGAISGLVDLLIQNECIEGEPELMLHDNQFPQYLTLNY